MPIDIDFEWKRDESGYDIVTGKGATAFEVGAGGQLGNPRQMPERQIVPRGGPLVLTPPLSPDLYLVFARSARSEDGLLEFVRQHGPLNQHGNSSRGESVPEGLDVAAQMRELLARNEKPAKLLDDEICVNIDLVIGTDPISETPKLKYRVENLLAALWVQCAEAVTQGTSFRECEYCGALFKRGLGAGRREDSKYCTPAHRIAHNSRKRGKKSAADAGSARSNG
jgi:hypothetical protein